MKARLDIIHCSIKVHMHYSTPQKKKKKTNKQTKNKTKQKNKKKTSWFFFIVTSTTTELGRFEKAIGKLVVSLILA